MKLEYAKKIMNDAEWQENVIAEAHNTIIADKDDYIQKLEAREKQLEDGWRAAEERYEKKIGEIESKLEQYERWWVIRGEFLDRVKKERDEALERCK